MRMLPLLFIVLLLACGSDTGTSKPAPDSFTPVAVGIVDSMEQWEYVIADTVIDGHHLCIDRHPGYIRVTHDQKQTTIDWPDYQPECEQHDGLIVIEQNSVKRAYVVAIAPDEFYFGCFQSTCRGFANIFRCVVLPDGGLECSETGSYWRWTIIDPVRRLRVGILSVPYIVIDSTGADHWLPSFYVRSLLQDSTLAKSASERASRNPIVNESDPLFDVGHTTPSDKEALELHRRLIQ